ncbi:MAG: hypothetical protein QME78_13215 [Thermodesulfobacteriota bacterium]|nr:hypothetical protein [Thermodesulfobacteriota bacterium]
MKTAEAIELGKIIAALILQFGVPAAMLMIQSFQKEEITDEDIRGLKNLVRPPEDYFPGFKKGA